MKYLITALLGLVLAATSVSAQSNYRIRSGDTISVEVLEDAQLNRQLLVLPDGSTSFPFAGSIQVGGKTVAQVQSTITQAIASNFAATPTVFVTVSSLRLRTPAGPAAAPATIDVYFTGEVASPGLKAVAPGTTFLQAIAQAGGLSNFAATKRIQVRRTDPKTGQQSVFVVNYKALSHGAVQSAAIFLKDGDVILVPERRLFE